MSYYHLHKIEKIRKVSKSTHQIHIAILNLIKDDLDLLNLHSKTHEFHEAKQHPRLTARDSLVNQIQHMVDKLKNNHYQDLFEFNHRLKGIQDELTSYDDLFHLVIQKVIQRGFKDFGIEGKMRLFAHELEHNYQNRVKPADLLMLRRHEKDYILRKENVYIQKLNQLSREIQNSLLPENEKNNEARELIESYQRSFNQLTALDNEIGIENNAGLKADLNLYQEKLTELFNELSATTETKASVSIQEGTIIFSFIVVFSIIFSLITSFFITQKFTRPIKKLSNTMDNFIVHKDFNEKIIGPQNSTYELDSLAKSFINLTKQVKCQFEEIEEKSSLLEKQNEDLSKFNKELDRFIYSVAHDLKSPLASLEGLVNLAKIDIAQSEHQHYFEMMNGSITKLLSFINDIVNYTRNKRLDLEVEEVLLEKMVNSLFNQYQFIEGRENIRKELKIAQTSPFFSDGRRVQMILTNIISNAVQYYNPEEKKPWIEVKIYVSKEKATIRIEDNGVGINENYLESIFDMFFRASEDSKGSGLGLYIVQETTKILEGTVKVSSKMQFGTCFTIELPNHPPTVRPVDKPLKKTVLLNRD